MKRNIISLVVFTLLLVNAGYVRCVGANNYSPLQTRLAEEFRWLQEETLVWSASKYQQKSSEAPSSVSVVTSDDIRKFGYRTLSDVLKRVSGFYTVNTRNYEDVGIRGFKLPGDYSTRMLLLIDGHRINDNLYDSSSIGANFPLDTDMIDRVEITRGPGSCLYGNNAFLGVINVISKKAENIDGVEISAEGGSLDTYKSRASYAHKISDNSDVLFSISAYDSNGNKNLYYKEFDDPSTNNGVAENLDGEKFYKLFFKMSFNHLTLTGLHSLREKDVPTAAYATWFDKPFDTIERRSYAEMKYDYSYDKDTSGYVRFYYDRYVFNSDTPYQSPDETLYYNRERDLSDWIGGEVKLTRNIFGNNNITIGAEYQYNINQNIVPAYDAPYDIFPKDESSSATYAVYLQDEFRIRDNLILNAGVRYDHYESFGGTTNPRLALIYSPYDLTTIKLIYGTAFRSPNRFELYTNQIAYETAMIRPEKISTYEAVLEQRFGKYLQGVVSGFVYKIDGLISQIPSAGDWTVYRNTDNVDAKGIEAELRAKWENGVSGSVNYTFQDVRNTQTDDVLPISPKHLIKATVVFPLISDKIFVSSEGQYMSSRKTVQGNDVEEYFIINTTLFCMNIVRKLEFSAGIYNLFDKIYEDPGYEEHRQDAIEQNGRTFRFKLTYSF